MSGQFDPQHNRRVNCQSTNPHNLSVHSHGQITGMSITFVFHFFDQQVHLTTWSPACLAPRRIPTSTSTAPSTRSPWSRSPSPKGTTRRLTLLRHRRKPSSRQRSKTGRTTSQKKSHRWAVNEALFLTARHRAPPPHPPSDLFLKKLFHGDSQLCREKKVRASGSAALCLWAWEAAKAPATELWHSERERGVVPGKHRNNNVLKKTFFPPALNSVQCFSWGY